MPGTTLYTGKAVGGRDKGCTQTDIYLQFISAGVEDLEGEAKGYTGKGGFEEDLKDEGDLPVAHFLHGRLKTFPTPVL